MKLNIKLLLIGAWNWCDEHDKSTEFMFIYMSDTAGVDYDTAVSFVVNTSSEERSRLTELFENL